MTTTMQLFFVFLFYIGRIKEYFPTTDIAYFFIQHPTLGSKIGRHPTFRNQPDTRHPTFNTLTKNYETLIFQVDTPNSHFKVDIQHCQKFELDTRHSYPPLWALYMFGCEYLLFDFLFDLCSIKTQCFEFHVC